MQKVHIPFEYPIQPKSWRKKYKCHKNKGDHTFIVEYAYLCDWQFMSSKIFEYSVCTACKKNKFKIVSQ